MADGSWDFVPFEVRGRSWSTRLNRTSATLLRNKEISDMFASSGEQQQKEESSGVGKKRKRKSKQSNTAEPEAAASQASPSLPEAGDLSHHDTSHDECPPPCDEIEAPDGNAAQELVFSDCWCWPKLTNNDDVDDANELAESRRQLRPRRNAGDDGASGSRVADSEDISGDDSEVDRAYVPPEGGTSSASEPEGDEVESSVESDPDDPKTPGETEQQRHLRHRRIKRRMRAPRLGKPYSQAPSALASRHGYNVQEATDPERSLPRKVMTSKTISDVEVDEDDEAEASSGRVTLGGVDVFRNVSAHHQQIKKARPPPCREEPFLGHTAEDDLSRLLGDTSELLYKIEHYLIQVGARQVLTRAVKELSKKKKRKTPKKERYSDEFGPAYSQSGGSSQDCDASQVAGQPPSDPGSSSSSSPSSNEEDDDAAMLPSELITRMGNAAKEGETTTNTSQTARKTAKRDQGGKDGGAVVEEEGESQEEEEEGGTAMLERREGNPVVTQAVTWYHSLATQQSFPKLLEVLKNFHKDLANVDKSTKGKEAAKVTFKHFPAVICCYIVSLDPEDRKEMELKDVLRALNTAMVAFRNKIGNTLRQETIKRYLQSVTKFGLYVTTLQLEPEVIGNFHFSNIKALVSRQCAIVSNDQETFALYEPIDERNIRTNISLEAVNKHMQSPYIQQYVDKCLEVSGLLDRSLPVALGLAPWAPSRQTAGQVRGILITFLGMSTARRSLEMATFDMHSFRNPVLIEDDHVLYKVRRHKTGKSLLCYIAAEGPYSDLLQAYVKHYRTMFTMDVRPQAPVFVSGNSSFTDAKILLVSAIGTITEAIFKIEGEHRFTLRKFRKFYSSLNKDVAGDDDNAINEMALIPNRSIHRGWSQKCEKMNQPALDSVDMLIVEDIRRKMGSTGPGGAPAAVPASASAAAPADNPDDDSSDEVVTKIRPTPTFAE
ncbi:hypothetical protein HAZT_HAZT002847 [Hyalella azteca]|uniref:Uncharacterized protein n=1 Tax=Hyalella azteca TaxID=294128 RepID=A0A6A0H4D7_HYAAZ|nr:hypothetical protein HAZT_HAZT002847 [Hyalella azteca]